MIGAEPKRMRIEPLVKRPHLEYVRVGSVLCSLMTGPPTAKEFDDDFHLQTDIVARYGHLSCLVMLNTDGIGRPDPAIKDKTAEQARKLGNTLITTALVVLGSGFQVTMMRTALIAYNLLSKTGARQKVFSTPEDGVAWVRGFQGQGAEVAELDATEIKKYFNLSTRRAA